MIRELESAAALRRQTISAILSREGLTRDYVQVLQLFEEVVLEAERQCDPILWRPLRAIPRRARPC